MRRSPVVSAGAPITSGCSTSVRTPPTYTILCTVIHDPPAHLYTYPSPGVYVSLSRIPCCAMVVFPPSSLPGRERHGAGMDVRRHGHSSPVVVAADGQGNQCQAHESDAAGEAGQV